MFGEALAHVSGMLVRSSNVNTDLNCSLRILALLLDHGCLKVSISIVSRDGFYAIGCCSLETSVAGSVDPDISMMSMRQSDLGSL